jgi:putative YjhG/YagF family dehydratase
LPAIAYAAGLRRPTVEDWEDVNRRVPRLVDALPNGPVGHPTVRVFLAGGVPEVMLHLRELGLLELDAMTVAGVTWGEALDWWQASPRREAVRETLRQDRGARLQRAQAGGIDPEDVIMSHERARERGLTSTVCFPRGNLAPEGSVIKSTAIDPRVVDADGVYRKTGPARVFTRETDAIAAIKQVGPASRAGPGSPPSLAAPGPARLAAPTVEPIKPGDVIVLMGRGPLGSGMEETYQITSALKHLSWGREVAVITDARFSGVSTGACIGHIGPEALAGGPLGKLRDGDRVRIVIDRHRLVGSIDFVGDGSRELSPAEGAAILAARSPHPQLSRDPRLPDDTRLWAALVRASGGTWGGCVYDVERIIAALED